MKSFRLPRLKFLCCGWETRPVQFRDSAGHEYSIFMGSTETIVTRRADWRKIAEFEITVERLTEEI